MKRLIVAFAAPMTLALSGCAGFMPPQSPSQAADSVILDERAALAIELAYNAAGTALEAALDAGLITGSNLDIAREANGRAYGAVLATRAAYDAGNADSYDAALEQSRVAISQMLTAVKGK